MTLNRRQLRERVEVQLGIPSTGSGFLTPDRINGFISDALARISDDSNWPWLLTSTTVTFAATTGISTTTLTRPIHTLVIANLPARYVGMTDFLDPSGRDWSHVWTVAGTFGRLDPAPVASTDGTLWYYQAEPELADDDDAPLMHQRHMGTVVAFASHLGWLARTDEPAAQVQYAEYEQALKAMRSAQTARQGPGAVRVRSGSTRYASWT